MYSKVEEYKNILKSDEQQYDAYIVLEDGTKVDSDISGLRTIYNLGEKIIGNFTTKKIEFTLFNTSKYNITNKEIEAFVGLKVNDEFNYISLGKFITDKPVIKDEVQDECTISATNYSLKFKVPYKPILTFPCTINKAIKDICDHLNIEYVENDFINKDYVLQEFFIEEDATFFDVIKILVEAGFANAIITNTNALIVKSPSVTADYELGLNELFDLKKEDNIFGPINSIVASRIVADDGSTTEDVYKKNEDSISKNGLYEYKIIQNEAIDYDRQTAVNNMLAGILNFKYNPAKIEAVYNPAVEIGDMLKVPDKKTATSFLLFAKEIIADLSNGLMTIESTEKTQTETDYKSATNKDKKRITEAKVNKLEGKITLLAEEQNENTQRLAEYKITLDGVTQTVSNIDNDLANNYYTKTEATSQMNQTAEAFDFKLQAAGGLNLIQNSTLEQGFDVNNIMSGDVSLLKNIDVKNNTVSKSAIKINNGSVKTGKIHIQENIEYTFSCLIWKNELTNVIVKIITDKTEEYDIQCETNKFNKFSFVFSSCLDNVEIEISSDNNYCLVADRMLNAGNSALGWQPYQGEVITDNVKITNNGIEIESTTSKTKWLANASENKIINKDNGEEQVVFSGDLTTLNRVCVKDKFTVGKLRTTVLDDGDIIFSFDD